MANDYEVILNDEDILDNDLSVSTDLDDYAPGSTAKITATGVTVGGTVTFEVDHVSGPGADETYGTADDEVVELGGDGHDSWTVTDGGEGDLDGEANGIIVTEWYVNPDDSLDETFLLSADDGTTTTFTTFTDSLPSEAGVDLTISSPDSQIAYGAVWTNDVFGAGTGIIDPFLRVQSNSTESGVNTSGDLNNDEKAQANGYTRDLMLNEIAEFDYTDLPGTLPDDDESYYEFRLDINENSNSNGDNYLSLDTVVIFVSTEDNLTLPDGTNFTNGSDLTEGMFIDSDDDSTPAANEIELVYNLDADGDTWIALNYDLQAGSGVGDIAMYIPESAFEDALIAMGLDPNREDVYVYLYSSFGAETESDGYKWSSSDGFEEWSILKADPAASIVGYKYEDINGDGVKDAEDTGISPWYMYLYVDDGDGVFDADDVGVEVAVGDNADFATETINADGQYGYFNFGGLDPDLNYWLVESNQSGWANSNAITTTINGLEYVHHSLIDPTANEVYGDESGEVTDFLNYQKGAISGTKYEDDNGNTDGANGDTPLAGVTIYLFQLIDGSYVEVATAVTDDAGAYTFSDLEPGTYRVSESADLADDQDGTPTTIAVDGETWVAVGDDTASEEITLGSGDSSTDNDFFNYQKGAISGTKYEDADGLDATTDDRQALEGWVITLTGDTDGDGVDDFTATQTTDGSGFYAFDDLEPGDYVITEEDRDGWTNVTPVTITAAGLTSGFALTEQDFANFELASIEGYKFWDLVRDGIWETLDGETGANGWEIQLLDDTMTVIDTYVTGSEEGQADGYWYFDDLGIGTYYIQEVLIGGFVQTLPDDGLYKVVVDQSGEIYIADTDTGEMLLFGNDKIDGPGVRTPGFWQGKLGQTYWDGDSTNDGIIEDTGNDAEKEGDGFAENDVIVLNYGENDSADPMHDAAYWDRVSGEPILLIGDWEFDGVLATDEEWYEDGPGNDDLGVTLTEALNALQGNGLDGVKSRGKDWGKTDLIERDLVASWLNVMAGNDASETAAGGEDAHYWIDQAITYLNAAGANDKMAWSAGVRYDSNGDGKINDLDDYTESGSDIHNALDGWNNSGELDGFSVAVDGDDTGLAQFQSFYEAVA